jgi:signal transduction histidine kinase
MSVLRYAQRTREPLVVADATGDDRFARDPYFTDVDSCSLLAVPILRGSVLRAVLVLENRLIRGAFSSERLDAVKLITGQLAVSLDNAQLYAELGASRARVVGSADETRRRIERDIHDGAQQRLVSLALQLRAVQSAVPPGLDGLEAELDGVVAGLDGALEELLEVARGIHPAALAEGGLGPALKSLVRRSAVPVDANVRIEGRLPEPVEVAAYYVVSEALTNAAKHAQATSVTVDVDAGAHVLQVRVSDDGMGGADVAGGSGLVGLKDRVEAIGGTLTVQSRPGDGTRLDVELPLNGDRPTSSS